MSRPHIDHFLSSRGLKRYGFLEPEALAALVPAERGGGRAALVLLFPYPLPDEITRPQGMPGPAYLRVAAFAAANHYRSLSRLLQELAGELRRAHGMRKSELRVAVNSGLPEKTMALAAGLGFIGRSSLLINPGCGAAALIGALLLPEAAIAGPSSLAAAAQPSSGCGSCTACVTACPTAAISAETGLRPDRCLQYWLSGPRPVPESPDAGLAAEVLSQRGRRLYGCDECITACPHTRGRNGAEVAAAQALVLPGEARPGPWIDASFLANSNPESLRQAFKATALGLSWFPWPEAQVFALDFLDGMHDDLT